MANTTSEPAALQDVLQMIVKVERELTRLERSYASVSELLPHVEFLHRLQDRESELRGDVQRAHRKSTPRPAMRRR